MEWTILLVLLVSSWSGAAERDGKIIPDLRGAECHPMMGACPAGWHEKGPKRHGDQGGSENDWVECCQNDGEFVPLWTAPLGWTV